MIFSPGKLLLTSEYVVMDGALALAVPTHWGQEFTARPVPDGKSQVLWQANHQGKPWLTAIIDYKNEIILSANNPGPAGFVVRLLNYIKQHSAVRLQQTDSYEIVTDLQFPANYGLGSSSTLMCNLAQWAVVDAFELNENCLGGSGYDVAVAQHKTPILYRSKPTRTVSEIKFDPAYKDELIFIHLNQKQDSRAGISLYRERAKSNRDIEAFSQITQQILDASDLQAFSNLMTAHEQRLSKLIGLQTVKEKLFPDCPAFVKSLGAWGGDFVLSAGFPGYREYFNQKGFPTVFSYTDLIS